MARTPKRSKPKSRHYRCARCQSLVAWGYDRCGNCGYSANDETQRVDKFIDTAKRMFPGSYELH